MIGADEEGICYRGTFKINPKFNLRDNNETELVKGHATPEGTRTFSERSSMVHPSNFKTVGMPSAEQLTLSKIAYGTATGTTHSQQDFFQYFVLKNVLLSGGINHIDTGHSLRSHRAEYTSGRVLRTLFNKFGLGREEVFVNSKQGFVGNNAYDKA